MTEMERIIEVRTYTKTGNKKNIIKQLTQKSAELIYFRELQQGFPAPTLWENEERLEGY